MSQSFEPSARCHPTGSAEHLLVVDDEPMVRTLAGRLLEAAGYRVTLVADGLQALEAVLAHPGAFDAVVSDVVMPGLDGHGLYRALQAAPVPPPVLLMSGYSVTDLPDGCSVPCGVLRKPFDPMGLLTAVRQCIDHARTAESRR
jgi:two-component system cell cycle sensor histidine kinase/response regulator CckA